MFLTHAECVVSVVVDVWRGAGAGADVRRAGVTGVARTTRGAGVTAAGRRGVTRAGVRD
ncbi:hypothetical protein [Deinococcus yunweiensis]|uniref:hypothetical protein n=1 Tax=Deinococcus yunweiensis TaxID=367282 RepID=UPI00398F4F49